MEKYSKSKISSFPRMLLCVSFLIWPTVAQSDIYMEVYFNKFNPTFTFNISFTLEMFTRLQACFCDQSLIQCRAKYSITDDAMVYDIDADQGSSESSLVTCENRLQSSSLNCTKVNNSIDPCNYPMASDFFIMPSSLNCPKTCFGFFWNNSQERFVSSNATVESCDGCGGKTTTTSKITTTTSTSTESTTTTSVTTTTTPTTTSSNTDSPTTTGITTTTTPISTSTNTDSTTTTSVTTTTTPTSTNTTSTTTPTTTSINTDNPTTHSITTTTTSTTANSNKDNRTLIIGLAVGLSVLATVIVILAVIVCRQRRLTARQSPATKSMQAHKSSPYAVPATDGKPTELVRTAENNMTRPNDINYYNSPRPSSGATIDSRHDYGHLYDLPEDDNGETLPEDNETLPKYIETDPEYNETVQEYIVVVPEDGEPVREDSQTVTEGREPPAVCQSGGYITPMAHPMGGGTSQMYEEESIIPHW